MTEFLVTLLVSGGAFNGQKLDSRLETDSRL
jgi:hypothetical protein